jgi:hypothetical protein
MHSPGIDSVESMPGVLRSLKIWAGSLCVISIALFPVSTAHVSGEALKKYKVEGKKLEVIYHGIYFFCSVPHKYKGSLEQRERKGCGETGR